MKFLQNLWNLLPAAIGTLQAILPLLKELVVVVVRIIALLPFLWDKAEPIIENVNDIYEKIYDGVERFKNLILFIEGND